MIQYTGRGDQCKITVIVMGDGLNKELNVDVTKPPYNLNFASSYPTKAIAFASTPVQPSAGPPSETFISSADAQANVKSVDFTQGKIKVVFNKAPTRVEFNSLGLPVLRVRLDIYLIYDSLLIPGADTIVGVFTATVADDRILIPNHGLVNGNQIKFKLDDPMTCALPTPLVEVGYYFVVNTRGNDFMVSSTSGGPVINITDKGIGSNEVWKKNP